MINAWTIKLDKLPQYKAFSQPWTETLDKALMQRIVDLPDNHPFFNAKGTFVEQKRHLKDVINRMDGDNLYVNSYRAKGLGRFYPRAGKDSDDYKKGMSIICLGRRIKHSILKPLGWRDVDMCSAHPSILYGIAKANKRDDDFPVLARYTQDKRPIIDEIKTAYSLPENPLTDDDVKDLLSAFAYGGGFNRWLQDPDIPEVRNIGKIKIVADFQAECRKGIEIVYNNNKAIVDAIKEDGMTEWDIKKRVFSYWCGIIENDILFIVYKYLLKEGIVGDKLGAKEYDGLCFKPLKHFNENDVCETLSTLVLKDWKFKMLFKFKDYSEAFIFPEPEAVPKTTAKEFFILNDLDAAKTVFNLYPHWVYCKGKLWVYNVDNGLWSCDKSAYRSICIKFVDNLYLCKPTTDGIKKTTKSYGNDANLMSHLPPLLETMNQDDNWENNVQNSSLGYLLFNNGIYHFETDTFTEVKPGEFNRPDIFFHAKINFDYCYDNLTDEMIEYMVDIRQRIFLDPLGEEQGKYFLELISRAVAGNKMKKIIFGIGNGNNGKSVIAKAISNAIGLYCGSFNAESLAYRQNSQDEAAVMRWALLARYNRVLFSNELKTSPGKPTYLDANMIKKISSGGDTLVGRGHCQAETEFIPHFLGFIMANDMVEIKPYDNALDNRLNIFHFKKQFVSCPSGDDELLANPDVVHEIETLDFKKCMIGILIQAYSAFVKKGRVDEVPQSVLKAKSDWVPEDTSMIQKFLDIYEFTNNIDDFIFSKDIGYWAEQNKLAMSTTKIALEIKKYVKKQGFDNICNKDKKVNGKTSVVWTGIRLRVYKEENKEEK